MERVDSNKSAHLYRFFRKVILQVDRLPRLCPGGKTGEALRKQLLQKCGFSAASRAGQDQVAFTAVPERIPDRVCGWPVYRRRDRLHTLQATPFLPQ